MAGVQQSQDDDPNTGSLQQENSDSDSQCNRKLLRPMQWNPRTFQITGNNISCLHSSAFLQDMENTDASQQDTEEEERNKNMSDSCPDWSLLPELVLVKILKMLCVLDRLNMSNVCCSWQAASTRFSVWKRFDYGVFDTEDLQPEDEVQQVVSCHRQYLSVIRKYGRTFEHVHLALHCDKSLALLRNLTYYCSDVISCIVEVKNDQVTERVHFEDILLHFLAQQFETLQQLCLKNVHFLKQNGFVTPVPIGRLYTEHLRKLSLIGSFRGSGLSNLMFLTSLTELTISPLQLHIIWLSELATASLRTLNIVGGADMLNEKALYYLRYPNEEQWQTVMQTSKMQVHCYYVCLYSQMFCPHLPLVTLCATDLLPVGLRQLPPSLMPYSDTLTTLINFNLFKLFQTEESSGVELSDEAAIVEIIQRCSKLTTVAFTNKLYSSTFLLMTQLNPNLKEIYVCDSLVQYEFHMVGGLNLSPQVRSFVEENSSRERFAQAMSQAMKRSWLPLSDEEYMYLLHSKYYRWSALDAMQQ